MKPRTIQITATLVNTCDLGKDGPQIDPTQFPQRNGFPKKLAGEKRVKFFIGGIIPERLLKEMFLQCIKNEQEKYMNSEMIIRLSESTHLVVTKEHVQIGKTEAVS
jgi:hypothetical protein